MDLRRGGGAVDLHRGGEAVGGGFTQGRWAVRRWIYKVPLPTHRAGAEEATPDSYIARGFVMLNNCIVTKSVPSNVGIPLGVGIKLTNA